MKIAKEDLKYALISFIFSILFLVFSLYIYPYYQFGDQTQYRLFYENAKYYDFFNGLEYYRNVLGTVEPIYFIIVKFFSIFFSKDVFFSVINSIIVFFLFFRLLKIKVAFYFLMSLIFNFYFLVLLFAAERLKIAFLFILFSLSFIGHLRTTFLSLAFLSHIQSIFLIFIVLFKGRIENVLNQFSFRKILILFILSMVLGYLLKGHILNKLDAYINNGGFLDVFKSSIFIFLSFLCAPRDKKLEIFILGTPLIVAAFFIGADRVVMMTYILFLVYGLRYKKGYNIFVFISTLYFCWKGYDFLLNIIHYGDGFYQ